MRQLAREITFDRAGFGRSGPSGRTEPTPSEVASRGEQERRLTQILDGLPADYREVLILRHREQWSFPQIARRMGRTTDAVRMLWCRAFHRLSAELERAAGS